MSLTESDLKFVFSVLKNCSEIRPDWTEVAQENGIGYARNASSRLNNILKKVNLKYTAGKIVDDTGENSKSAPSKRPTKRNKSQKASDAPEPKRKKTNKSAKADVQDADPVETTFKQEDDTVDDGHDYGLDEH